MKFRTFLFFVLCLFGTCHFFAQESSPVGSVKLLFPSQSVAPGDEVEGIIRVQLQPGWHTYWKNPGDSGLAPSFDWELPHGIKVQELVWPTPSFIRQGESGVYGYENSPEWIVRLSFDKDLSPETYKIRLTSFFLACDGMCTPVASQSEFSFTLTSAAPRNVEWNIAEMTASKLPIPLSSGKAKVENNVLTLTLPLEEEQTALAKEVFLFPETERLFSSDILASWKKDESHLYLSVPLAHGGGELLRDKKEFSGLVQILSKDTKKTYSFTLPVEYISPASVVPLSQPKLWKEKDVSSEKIFEGLPLSLGAILLAAFLGGLLLNVTPCVLPVIGLRILHLLSFREKNHAFLHGIVFTFGVLTAFWALAGALYLLTDMGKMIGWGFQLQEPFFVSALIIVLFIFSMSLFGLFEMGASLSAWAGEKESALKKTPSYTASYMNGMLATLIATPCTGPFLGSVLGFAATFDPKEGFYLFSAIGLGMAFPFLMITLFPPLMRLLPRPGPWMEGLKQFFGFLLLATVLWLLWVLNSEVRNLSLFLTFLSFWLLSFGCWILGRWGSPVRGGLLRFFAYLLALSFLLIGALSLLFSFESKLSFLIESNLPQYTSISWKPYSKYALEMELKKGKTVFVNFSAKWCLTCQINKLIFMEPSVIHAFRKNNIVAFNADWTNGDAEITEMLRSLGRNGVPVYAFFRADKEPVLLPEILTADRLVTAIEATKPEGAQS